MPTLSEAISKRYISCGQINYIIDKISIIIFIVYIVSNVRIIKRFNNFTQFFSFFILTILFLNDLIHMNREACAYNIDFDIECN